MPEILGRSYREEEGGRKSGFGAIQAEFLIVDREADRRANPAATKEAQNLDNQVAES